ncbi:hypothetical protein ACXIUT_27850 [Achromobacter denitrificans]
MTEFEIAHGLSQDQPGPLEPVELAKVPAAKQFRKKPVVVQAVQYPCAHPALQRCSCDANSACSSCGREFIMTLEGPLNVSPGDWIITGVQGEHYPCKPDIFAATYEEAAAPVSTVAQGDAQDELATYSLQPLATAFFTEKGEVAYTGIYDRTLKALEAVKTTRMGISAGSIDLYARPHAPAAGDALDAARYRWLCDKFGITKLPCAIERIIEGSYVPDGKAAIDAAIDTAIAAQRKGDA